MLKIQVPGVGIIEVPEEEKENLAKIISAFSPEKQAQEDRTAFFSDLNTLLSNHSKETTALVTRMLEAVAAINIPKPHIEFNTPDLTEGIKEGLKEAIKELRVEPKIELQEREITLPEVKVEGKPTPKKLKVSAKRVFGSDGKEVEGTVEVLEWV